MSKRPIPTPKTDDALDDFIKDSPVEKKQEQTIKSKIEKKVLVETKVKKSLKINENIDNALRLESATTREKQQDIIEKAIREYLVKKGYKNI